MKSGLQTVTLNPLLNASAQAKAVDMATKNYWAHNAPDGSQPWLFITAQGYSYTAAGENLACSFTSSKAVLDGWMNSPKHKENVLNPVFTEVGFGVIKAQYYICGNIPAGENYIVVQHFATPY